MTFTVELHGPFFDDAVWDQHMRTFMSNATMDIADQGTKELRTAMVATFRHETGLYRSTVKTREQAFGTAVIDGQGTVYAWWLEGVGSRNSPVTRFPGYHLFLKETAKLNRGSVKYLERSLTAFIAEVNA
jgi:hypothetical protein